MCFDCIWFSAILGSVPGGLGINLTSANVVVLHDIDFNPTSRQRIVVTEWDRQGVGVCVHGCVRVCM